MNIATWLDLLKFLEQTGNYAEMDGGRWWLCEKNAEARGAKRLLPVATSIIAEATKAGYAVCSGNRVTITTAGKQRLNGTGPWRKRIARAKGANHVGE
jgi:hypothetical protein